MKKLKMTIKIVEFLANIIILASSAKEIAGMISSKCKTSTIKKDEV